MTSTLHATMHTEHKLWDSEISLWRDDVAAWQRELAHAHGEIKKLEEKLKQHEETLRQHAAAIRMQEQEADSHEHALAEFEKGGQGADLPLMAKKHQEESQRQAKQRAAHEDLKRHHHIAMAQWKLLLDAFCKL